MLLKSIEVKNFRLYRDQQKVEFSCDPQRNITVILGENATGKTTLAQAFTWCLYGDVGFVDKDPFSFVTRNEMPTNTEAEVFVSICLVYKNREYEIKRSKTYRKDGHGSVHPYDAVLEVSYIGDDGQTEYPLESELEKEETIQEILPKSLSGYFFFDGERIDRMGKDIQYGEGTQFAEAVRNLLGLSALSSAIDHLKSSGNGLSVISTYRKKISDMGDADQTRLAQEIEAYEAQLEVLSKEYDQTCLDKKAADALLVECKQRLEAADSAKRLQKEREAAKREKERAEKTANTEQIRLYEQFGGKRQGSDVVVSEAWSYLLTPLLKRSSELLEDHPVKDASLPGGITTDTITAILNDGKCICGRPIEPGSDAMIHLAHIADMVPPRYIGGAVKGYRSAAGERIRDTNTLLPQDVHDHIDAILDARDRADRQQGIIESIGDRLIGMADVEKLERDLRAANMNSKSLDDRKQNLYSQIQHFGRELEHKKEEQAALASKSTRIMELQRHYAYADYIYKRLSDRYEENERDIRQRLEAAINDVFGELFEGALSLSLDDDYNVSVRNTAHKDLLDGVETSEAQSIAVIFAFISGVLRLARDEATDEQMDFEPEDYPLVMDAPLSNFDKKRIESVCRVMPMVAEQVIIMIKDTDGELALDYMSDNIGAQYEIEHDPDRFVSTIVRK